jgi:hypothetical protein
MVFVDIVVGQEPMRGFRVGPVLTRERNRATDAAAELMKQAAQSLAQSCVAELTASDLASYPRCIVGCLLDACPFQ